MAEEKTQPKITESEILEAFKVFGYTPDAADLKYWSLKPSESLETLYDNLKMRRDKQTEAESNLNASGAGSAAVYGESFFRGGDNGALIKFSEDPDGSGPMNTSTVWLVEPKTKTLRPIMSEQAFNNYFETSLSDAANQGLIKTIPMSYFNQNSPLFGFKLLTDEYGIKNDGSAKPVEVGIDLNKVSNRYGYQNDDELNRNTLKILNGFLSTIKSDNNSGLSQSTIDKISNDKETISMYINALAYGGYQINDIYRDLKIKEEIANGNTQYSNTKAIDEGVRAEDYYNTPAGNSVRTNPSFTPPQYLGDIDSSVFNAPIFDIPSDVYEVLVPPFDWRSPEGQAELDTIKSAYHDVLLQQAEAVTERERAIADQAYKELQKSIQKKYGIALSDNANQAWKQLSSIGSNMSQRGLAGTGIAREEMDRYLADVRKTDRRNRESQLTEEEYQRMNQLIKYGTPEQIAALSDEEKEKYGFKPTQEVLNWFSKENLKNLYPDLTDKEIDNYISTMLDERGNYRSEIYQKLSNNKLDIEEQKKTYQLGSVQTDPNTGRVIGGSGVLYKKALEEEKAYAPYSTGTDFSKPTSTTPAISPSDSSKWSINQPKDTVTTPVMANTSDSSKWSINQPKTSTPTPAPTPAAKLPTADQKASTVTLYNSGNTMSVPSGDVSYWKNQGWATK